MRSSRQPRRHDVGQASKGLLFIDLSGLICLLGELQLPVSASNIVLLDIPVPNSTDISILLFCIFSSLHAIHPAPTLAEHLRNIYTPSAIGFVLQVEV